MKTLFVSLCLIVLVVGHSYITSPMPRILGSGCRIGGPPQFPANCPGPCEAKKDDTNNRHVQQTSRGAALTVDWPRNNHGGGFIRLAWAKHDNSDDFQAFNQGVQQVSCHETGYDGNPANTSPNRGCASDDPTNPMGGDTGSAQGGDRACRLRTTTPTWLSDGLWTMQWTWYGSGNGYLGDYYSCVDYQVTGGAALTAQAAPVFKGGDVTYPTDNTVCKFWNTDRPHYCWSEPCNDIWNSSFLFPNAVEQKGQAYLVPLAITATPTSAAPVTTANPTPSATIPSGDVPDIKASITVSLNVAPKLVDLTVFVYEVSANLAIPSSAIPSVVVDIDQSSDTVTIVHFEILNKLMADGTRVDPIASAYKLRQMAQDKNSALKSTALLSTMQVLDVQSEDQAKSPSFVGSETFIIIIAVVGGALIIGVVAAVVIVVVKKRRNTFF